MNKAEWLRKIKKAVKAAGTFRPYFTASMEALAGILERRDQAIETYERDGIGPTYVTTNTQGETVIKQNPQLKMINELNRDALSYWRDLGLTPAGLRRINEDAVAGKIDGGSALERALIKLSGS